MIFGAVAFFQRLMRLSGPKKPAAAPKLPIWIEHFAFEKFKCSNAARECCAPQGGVDSAENRIFRQNDNFENVYFQSYLLLRKES